MGEEQGSSGSSLVRQEFSVRLAAGEKKTYHLMKFGGSLSVDPGSWTEAEMRREDNRAVYETGPDLPETGAGSEFGRAAREEARRKRRGLRARRYRRDAQPWVLGVDGRRFRGMREGGAGQNADYWLFFKTAEGVFEAAHVADWYHFLPVARYKTLDIDQAEEQFKNRHRVLNTFALKAKIAAPDADPDAPVDEKSDIKRNASFKISDRDEYSSGDSDSDGLVEVKQEVDAEEDEDGKRKKGKKAGKAGTEKARKKWKKVKVEESDEVAGAESEDGEEEGREVADYISDSGSEPEGGAEGELAEKVEGALVGVDAERGLRTLLSDNEDEDEEEAAARKTRLPDKQADSDSDAGPDSDADDPDEAGLHSAVFLQEKLLLPEASGLKGLGQQQLKGPADGPDPSAPPPAKKARKTGDSMEREVIRYLQREKMTTKELLGKLKKKKEVVTGEAKSAMVKRLAEILRNVEAEFGSRFQKIQLAEPGKDKKTFYFHIKPA